MTRQQPQFRKMHGTWAVIGAGISGLRCARSLADNGLQVTIFEKSRGLGGRIATRRAELVQFDHGAQYWTARDPIFKQFVQDAVGQGFAQEWSGNIVQIKNGHVEPLAGTVQARYVGTPGNSSIVRLLSEPSLKQAIKFETRVASIERVQQQWKLISEKGEQLGLFTGVVVALPAPQALLLVKDSSEMHEKIAKAKLDACWALMVGFEKKLEVPFDAAFVNSAKGISWISRENAKPQRNSPLDCWMIHGSADFSEKTVEKSADEIGPQLLKLFREELSSIDPSSSSKELLSQEPKVQLVHKWRYASVSHCIEDPFLFDPNLRLGVCGDWCGGPRVEGAYMSGYRLAQQISSSPIAATSSSL